MNLLSILNIINDIYEHEMFPKILTGSIIVLIILFLLILLIGMKDAKKAKTPIKVEEEDIKDITFDIVNEKDPIKEDVTFEIPVLTKNLEDFKKNLEEEIQKESEIEIIKTVETEEKDEKAVKILDINEIEDTHILPVLARQKIEVLEEELPIKTEEKKNKEKDSKKSNKSE